MKFSVKDFFSKRDQIRSFLRIWSHLLKKSLMENFIFCAVYYTLMYAHSMHVTEKMYHVHISMIKNMKICCIYQIHSQLLEFDLKFDFARSSLLFELITAL